MAKDNTIRLDTSGLESLMRKLVRVEHAAAKETIDEVLTEAAQRIQTDTHLAMANNYLPAHGQYWTGRTAESIVDDTHVEWEGMVGSVPVGFDFSKPGAGGYLIKGRKPSATGTPYMAPDPMLNKMFRGKSYMKEIQEKMYDKVLKHIEEAWDKNDG